MRLKLDFWSALDEVAEHCGISVNEPARATLPRRGESHTSALRLFKIM